MIRIERKNDINTLNKSNTHWLIHKYITEYFELILNQNDCTDICEFGAFLLLEKEKEAFDYKELGLFEPLVDSLPEFTEIITLANGSEKVIMWHSCFVLSDSFAISVFADETILPDSIKEYLLQFSRAISLEFDKKKGLELL